MCGVGSTPRWPRQPQAGPGVPQGKRDGQALRAISSGMGTPHGAAQLDPWAEALVDALASPTGTTMAGTRRRKLARTPRSLHAVGDAVVRANHPLA